jgi:hypothetical protein
VPHPVTWTIPTPPGFDLYGDPVQLGNYPGSMWLAEYRAGAGESGRPRRGFMLARQTRAGGVRSLAIFEEEARVLLDHLRPRAG